MPASNVATLCPGCFADKGRANPCPHPQCGYDERTDRGQAPLPHRTLLKDQFLVGRLLGKPGGFGITYLGRDLLLETLVAIKELLPLGLVGRASDRLNVTLQSSHDGAAFREVLEQFLREGRTAFQLEHPNIVRVRHIFEANRTAYLVMDYFPGLSLDELVQRKGGRLPEDQARELLLPILDGLRAVHTTGFLHRDLKPQNIYLARTEAGGLRPILLDFGSARRAVREYGLTMPLVTHGWAPYEQYHSNLKEGPYSDIYAAAAVLYWMVTGTVPPDAYERQKRDLLKPATTFGVSPALSQAITEAMARDPKQRPQTVEHFQALLKPQPRPAAGNQRANQGAGEATKPEAEASAGRRPSQSRPNPAQASASGVGRSDNDRTDVQTPPRPRIGNSFQTLCPGCFVDKGRANPCPHCGYDEQAERSPLLIAHRTLLELRYLVGRALSKPGGFFIDYLGWDLNHHCLVAITEYLPFQVTCRDSDGKPVAFHSGFNRDEFIEDSHGFLREAVALAKLDHPNLDRIHASFQANGTAYLVKDYYKSIPLTALLQDHGGRLKEQTAQDILLPILDALQTIHGNGRLHLDVAPDCIMLMCLEGGSVRPVLWGIGSNYLTSIADLSPSGFNFSFRPDSCTYRPGYAPLEQSEVNGRLSTWSDVYSVGATLYRMVTGETPPAATERAARDTQKPATAFGVSSLMSDAIATAMSMEPSERPQTIEAFRALLSGKPQPPRCSSQGSSGGTPSSPSDSGDEPRKGAQNRRAQTAEARSTASSANRAAGSSEARGKPAPGAPKREGPPGYGAAQASQQAAGPAASSGKQLSDIQSVASLIAAAFILFVLTVFFGDRWFNWRVVTISLIAPLPGGILIGRFLSLRRRKLAYGAMMLGLIGLSLGAAIIMLAALQGLEIVTPPTPLLNEAANIFKMSALVCIPLLGQYLWRHRRSMSHDAIAPGIIMVSLCLYFCIGWPLFGGPLSVVGNQGHIVIAYLLSVGLSGQYFWRYRWILGSGDAGPALGIICLGIVSVYTWVQL